MRSQKKSVFKLKEIRHVIYDKNIEKIHEKKFILFKYFHTFIHKINFHHIINKMFYIFGNLIKKKKQNKIKLCSY